MGNPVANVGFENEIVGGLSEGLFNVNVGIPTVVVSMGVETEVVGSFVVVILRVVGAEDVGAGAMGGGTTAMCPQHESTSQQVSPAGQ